MAIQLPALDVRPPAAVENPMQQFGNMLQLKTMLGAQQAQQQESQLRGIQITQAQQQQKDQQTVMQALQANGGDMDKTLPQLAGKITPQTYLTLQKSHLETRKTLAEINDKELAVKKDQNDRLSALTQQLQALPDDQYAQAWPQAVASARSIAPDSPLAKNLDPNQPVPKTQLAQVGLGLMTTEQYFKAEADRRAQQEQNATLPGKQAEADQKVRSNAATQLAGATSAQDYAAKLGELPFKVASQFPKPEEWTPDSKQAILNTGMTPHEQASVPLDRQEASQWLKENPGKSLADFMKYKATLVPAFNFNLQNTGTTGNAADVAKHFGMSPVAFDQAAEKYWSSGQLPPAGRGGPALALNKAIMNRVAELHPEGSLAGNAAAFKANQDSLKGLQKQFDQVTAFENTAGKNLDVFLGTAKKVVDSGSSWINRPLRTISGGLGGEDQAAFDAARTTALTEIAKVLNSSNASGVLSDSARHEVEGLIGPGATLKQVYSAANILKKDMANRHQSYANQIKDIQGRLSGTPQTQQQATPPPSSGSFNWDSHPKVNQ